MLGRVSCSTSDGGVDDGGKKRKPFVDQNSLVTFVSRLFGRIDALYCCFSKVKDISFKLHVMKCFLLSELLHTLSAQHSL